MTTLATIQALATQLAADIEACIHRGGEFSAQLTETVKGRILHDIQNIDTYINGVPEVDSVSNLVTGMGQPGCFVADGTRFGAAYWVGGQPRFFRSVGDYTVPADFHVSFPVVAEDGLPIAVGLVMICSPGQPGILCFSPSPLTVQP